MDIITPGFLIVFILGLLVAEGAVFVWWRRRNPNVPLVGLLANLAAGGFLLLAFSAYIARYGAGVIAILFGGALLAHLVDLWARWPRGAQFSDNGRDAEDGRAVD
jgi:hypothetical protein